MNLLRQIARLVASIMFPIKVKANAINLNITCETTTKAML